MKNEIWMPVLDFEGIYEASSEGHIYSYPRKGTKGHIMNQTLCKTNGGYMMVSFNANGKHVTKLVSHVIWEAFNGPIPPGYEVNHINEDKTDNRLCNLNLLSRKDNCNWGTRNERIVKSRKGYGREIGVIQYRLDGTEVADYRSMRKAEAATGINCGEISKCARGLIPNTGLYYWKQKEQA